MDGPEKSYVLMETRPRVLAESFRKSRDLWKDKCQQAKAELQKFRERIRDLEISRAQWRDEAEFARGEKQRIEEETQQLRERLAIAAQDIAAQDIAAQDIAAQDIAAQDTAAQDTAAVAAPTQKKEQA